MPADSWEGLPQLDRDRLVDWGGWEVLKEARLIFEAGAVKEVRWESPFLIGMVGSGQHNFHPRLNLRDPRWAENRCACARGRKETICPHAIAICLEAVRQREAAAKAVPAAVVVREPVIDPTPKMAGPKSIVVAKHRGKSLVFRFFLPPNLSVSAPRDAIPVRLEAVVDGQAGPPSKIDRAGAYRLSEGDLQAAALIEGWCGGRLHDLLQLRRTQLQDLVAAYAGQPRFFWANDPSQAIPWHESNLTGVTSLIEESPPRAVQAVLPEPIQSMAVPSPTIFRTTAVQAVRKSTAGEIDGSTNFLALRLPGGDSPDRLWLQSLLRDNGFSVEPANGRWWLRDRHKTLNFLARYEKQLRDRHGFRPTANFLAKTACLGRAKINVRIREAGADFEIESGFEAGTLSGEAIRLALDTQRYYVPDGDRWWLLDPVDYERLTNLQRTLAGEAGAVCSSGRRIRVKRYNVPSLPGLVEELDEAAVGHETWRGALEALSKGGKLAPAPVDPALEAQLRGYQKTGVAWLHRLWKEGWGGVLADEMGLGKTVQALALTGILAGEARVGTGRSGGTVPRPEGPALVVAPAGLLENWRREAARFLPELRCFVHHREQRLTNVASFAGWDLILTSYQTLTRDEDLFREVSYAVILADEAQHVRNRQAQATQALRGLRAQARFALTGTPVENSLDDLRSIFSFVMPGLLSRLPAGADREEKEWHDARHLRQAAPFVLRRRKSEVATELPPKIVQEIPCPLTPAQRQLYEEWRTKAERELLDLAGRGAAEGSLRFAALTQLTRLRQICADPRLVNERSTAADSAKLAVFEEIFEEATDDGHRLLVFSQFVSVLRLLAEWLRERGAPFCYLDGSTTNRQGEIDRFQSDPGMTVFLLSLKAGGTGLNLTAADTVIHYDPWWNPAVEAQATDRAHRIGQGKTVTSLKLIAPGTVEERVVAMQKSKAGLIEALWEENARAAPWNLEEVLGLFRPL